MDEVFRFMNIRAAKSAAGVSTLSLTTSTNFQVALQNIRAGTAPAPWDLMAQTAASFIATPGSGFVADLSAIPLAGGFAAFKAWINASGATANQAVLSSAIKQAFGGTPPEKVWAPPDSPVYTLQINVANSIVAIYLVPKGYYQLLPGLVELFRMIGLIARAALKDPLLDAPRSVPSAMSATLVLPPAIFPVRTGQVMPVGVADLLVVKQHILRYEMDEIAAVENVLATESRSHTEKHTLSTERSTSTDETTTTETTTDQQTDERFDFKTQVENTIKEDLSLKSGVHVTAKYGEAVQVNANLDVAYNDSKSQSTQVATDHAKSVTTRALSKVTKSIRQTQSATTTETFEDTVVHGFDNTKGTQPVVGVYQWLAKVYQMQVFNYGKRLLFDVTVPEPAAFLRDAATAQQNEATPPPTPPPALTITPFQLSADSKDPNNNYYGIYVQRYGAGGVDAPPQATTSISKAYSDTSSNGGINTANITAADVLEVPAGYQVAKVSFHGVFNKKVGAGNYDTAGVGDPPIASIMIGSRMFGNYDSNTKMYHAGISQDLDVSTDPGGFASHSVGIAIETINILDFSAEVMLTCTLKPEALEQWKLGAYNAILKAYQQQVSDYQDQVSALQFRQRNGTLGPLDFSPDDNTRLVAAELKKSFLSMLTGRDLVDQNIRDVRTESAAPLFPRVDLRSPQQLLNDSAYVRFFEQAFEWDQIMYFFYPYFWGHKDTWYTSVLLQNADSQFADFLRAGSARVVVPVRPSFEGDLQYFIMTGQVWGGGDLPDVTDPRYVSIVQEVKEATGAPGTETPVGDPWLSKVPTTLIRLRPDSNLPGWKLLPAPPDWNWTNA